MCICLKNGTLRAPHRHGKNHGHKIVHELIIMWTGSTGRYVLLFKPNAPTPFNTPPSPHRLYDLQDTLDKLVHFLPQLSHLIYGIESRHRRRSSHCVPRMKRGIGTEHRIDMLLTPWAVYLCRCCSHMLSDICALCSQLQSQDQETMLTTSRRFLTWGTESYIISKTKLCSISYFDQKSKIINTTVRETTRSRPTPTPAESRGPSWWASEKKARREVDLRSSYLEGNWKPGACLRDPCYGRGVRFWDFHFSG